ncbi:uncharacterized protein PRCAT00004456001 [Priceomyces carsonii]|uniref:uncharacterized protein n=1 Tax=Priceomyces carsonii TaxID=28549 RepID=UPI002ED9E6C6|nr:unnamed protein product [Priceomyces carsonii]
MNFSKDQNGSHRGQWQQQQKSIQEQGASQQGMQNPPLANYTLPGVINYLTSEFTNLERFKIVTRLENSEMKYKILQLQGEMNSLRYINERQKTLIKELEEENSKLKGENVNDNVNQEEVGEQEIPEIDLLVIKKSRYQLTKSMKEILQLLKTPTCNNLNSLNLPDPSESTSEFDSVIDKKFNSFMFQEDIDSNKNANREKLEKGSIFSKYLSENNEDHDQSSEHSYREIWGDQDNSNDIDSSLSAINKLPSEPCDEMERFPTSKDNDLSDTETVFLDENPEKKILVPSLEIQVKETSFSEYKVFNSGGYITAMSFNSALDEKLNVRVWSYTLKDLVTETTLSQSLLGDNLLILRIYTLHANASGADFLFVFKSGQVTQVSFRVGCDPFYDTAIDLNQQGNPIISSDLIEFTHKSSTDMKYFGLIVNTSSKKSAYFKVYELNLVGGQLTTKEIGNYNKTFFKLSIKLSENDYFEFVHWFKNASAEQSKPSGSPKIKKHSKTVSCNDISLFQYEIILKLNKLLVKLNLISKQFSVLTEYDSSDSTWEGLVVSNFKLLVEPCSPTNISGSFGSYKIKLFDMIDRISTGELIVDDLQLAIMNNNGKLNVVKLQGDNLLIYDTSLTFIRSFKLRHTPETLARFNEQVVFTKDLESMQFYDIAEF